MRVFLSYGHDRNAPLVERIARDLAAAGHSVWRDTDEIKFGEDWRRRIVDGLADTDWALAFLSRHSTRDPGVCLEEWSIVLNVRAGNLATILVEPESEVDPPISLSRIQWLDMSVWEALQASDPERFEAWYAEKLKEILDLLDDPSCREFAGEIAALEHRLSPVGQEAEIGARVQGLVGRQWLAERVERWRREKSDERIFFLTGAPGAGKSAFSAWLAHHRPAVVVAVNFCRWNVDERCEPARVLRTLAFQLSSRLPGYRRLLRDRLANADEGAFAQKGPAALFDWLLVEPLRFAIDGGLRTDRLLAVIDGLDETLRDGRSALAETLAQGVQKLPPWIAFVVTSRREPTVLRQFSQFRSFDIEPGSADNQEDLRVFLGQWLDSSPQLAAAGPGAVERILVACNGNFLYLRMLREAFAGWSLDPAAAETLPRGLVGLYELWFRRQFPHSEDYEKALPLLELIVAAREPVPDAWIDRLLAWPKRERARVLESLGSLIARGPDGLAPFHKSLFDWLVDEDASGADYVVDQERGSRRLFAGLWDGFAVWTDGDRTTALDLFCARETPRLAERASDATLQALAAVRPWPRFWGAIEAIVERLPPERERETILAWWRLAARLAGFAGGAAAAQRSQALRAVGDLLRVLGRREDASHAYDEALAIARDMSACAEAGAEAKRALLSSLIRRGNRLVADGDGCGGLGAYLEALELARALLAEEPDDGTNRRGFLIALERVGDARLAMGDAAQALTAYQEGSRIVGALAEAAPADLDLQRDLAVNLSKIGDASMDSGDLEAALGVWKRSLDVARAIADARRSPLALRDVFAVLVRMGDAHLTRGELAQAEAAYREARDAIQPLANADRANVDLARDLWIATVKQCDCARAAGAGAAAASAAASSLELARKFLRADPGSKDWRHNLALSLLKVGDDRIAAGANEAAADAAHEALALAEELAHQSPDLRPYQNTLAAARNLAARAIETAERRS